MSSQSPAALIRWYCCRLGRQASEALAREKRYEFLHKVRAAAGAQAVVTAHHRDDALETAIINLARGTGRRGLTSLRSTDIVKRPLLHTAKSDLRDYAQKQELVWREDSTNTDSKYLRNHIRNDVVPRIPIQAQERFHTYIRTQHTLNQEIDAIIDELLKKHTDKGRLQRKWFINLPHDVSREVMAVWLRGHNIRGFDKKMLERLTQGAKIYKVGRRIHVTDSVVLKVGRDYLALVPSER
jgi:tRNA(Ile)-lysidine synthase TilS/MesJ